MANEFHYCASLSITHPSVDPKSISEIITEFPPRIETMAGSERRSRDGTLIVPHRKAVLSHWLAYLHNEERLYSGEHPVSDFLLGKLQKLEKYTDFISQMRQQGAVTLVIGWFSESNYTAEIFTAELLKKCGDIGLDIELNIYGHSST